MLSSQDYIEYHKRVVEAERRVLDSNYFEAVNIYQEILNEYEFVYASDCYTAAQTAVVISDFKRAMLFISKGFKQGLTLSMIEQDSLLVKLKSSSYWETIINNYDSLRSIYRSNINSELSELIDSVYRLDIKWRNKHELKTWNFLWKPVIRMIWFSKTKKIVEQTLFPSIIEYGYPGEKLIGLNKNSIMNRLDNYESKNSTLAFIILIHYYSKPRKSQINNILKNEISKGNITPSQYASIMDFQAKWGKQKYYQSSYLNEWHITDDTTKIYEIDIERTKIGLESLKVKEAKFQRGYIIGKEKKNGNFQNIYLFRTKYDS